MAELELKLAKRLEESVQTRNAQQVRCLSIHDRRDHEPLNLRIRLYRRKCDSYSFHDQLIFFISPCLACSIVLHQAEIKQLQADLQKYRNKIPRRPRESIPQLDQQMM